MTRVALEPNHTEQNPHLVDAAISPDRIQLVLPINTPDRFDIFADFWDAELPDRLPGVLVPKKETGLYHQGNVRLVSTGLPCGDHDDIYFNFASVIEKRTRFVEPLELRATLDLDLTVGDHRAGPDI